MTKAKVVQEDLSLLVFLRGWHQWGYYFDVSFLSFSYSGMTMNGVKVPEEERYDVAVYIILILSTLYFV